MLSSPRAGRGLCGSEQSCPGADSSPYWGFSRFGCLEAVWGLGGVEGGMGMRQSFRDLSRPGKAGFAAGEVSWPGSCMRVFGTNLVIVLISLSIDPVGLFTYIHQTTGLSAPTLDPL